VTIPVDSNLLIRHFTGDPPEMAARATAFIRAAGADELLVLDVHVAECVYVLEGPYAVPRGQVVQLLNSVLGVRSIQVEREAVIRRALHLYGSFNFDFPDAYLVAVAEAAGWTHIAGFDRFDAKLRKASPVRRIDPR
jgi:predicted nucleic-acid-binding protein